MKKIVTGLFMLFLAVPVLAQADNGIGGLPASQTLYVQVPACATGTQTQTEYEPLGTVSDIMQGVKGEMQRKMAEEYAQKFEHPEKECTFPKTITLPGGHITSKEVRGEDIDACGRHMVYGYIYRFNEGIVKDCEIRIYPTEEMGYLAPSCSRDNTCYNTTREGKPYRVQKNTERRQEYTSVTSYYPENGKMQLVCFGKNRNADEMINLLDTFAQGIPELTSENFPQDDVCRQILYQREDLLRKWYK